MHFVAQLVKVLPLYPQIIQHTYNKTVNKNIKPTSYFIAKERGESLSTYYLISQLLDLQQVFSMLRLSKILRL